MKTRLYLIFFLFLFLLVSIKLNAQELDTICRVQIYNTTLVKPDSISFELRIIRNSQLWSRWANGTFQIGFEDVSFPITDTTISIEYVERSSDLRLYTQVGQELPIGDYLLTPRVFNGRISITIVGPHDYTDAKPVPFNDTTGIKIGQFTISSKDGANLPKKLKWLQDYYYYQACAYKIQYDTLIAPSLIWEVANSNIEMFNGTTEAVSYEVIEMPEPEFILKEFTAEYMGVRKIGLNWETVSEAYNRGFIVRRQLLPFGVKVATPEAYNDLVGSYKGGKPEEANLVGLGTRKPGKKYRFEFDTVDYRGQDYCYLLQYEDFDGVVHDLAEACVPVPNSVITYAQPNPNPFSDQTTIKYKVDDNVKMTAKVYDANGKEERTLIDRETIQMGEHTIFFDASDLSSQGLYEVIFIAHPIDDPTVELSRAVVKLQLLR